jgi:hypothetical protein
MRYLEVDPDLEVTDDETAATDPDPKGDKWWEDEE